MSRQIVLLITLLAISRCVLGFSPTASDNRFAWELNNVVEALSENFEPTVEGLGGVKLAKESAIKIAGEIKHKPGKAESMPEELLRYNNLLTVDESVLSGVTVLCRGQGVEDYKDPGETTNKEVLYGPMEAIKDAITNAASAMDSETLVFNFLGGDDLMSGEVMEAGSELVLALDVPTSTKVLFNSLSHTSIPKGTCTVTVVSVGASDDSLSGVAKAVAQGEIYSRDGTWYTVEEGDINTALA